MYSGHYITRVQSMCAFPVMCHSLHPGPLGGGMKPDYGLSLRERYSPHFGLDGAARCFPVPITCMQPIMLIVLTAGMVGSTMHPRIRTMLASSRSLFLPPLFALPTCPTR